MRTFYQIKEIFFNKFPYSFQNKLYKELLFNYYPFVKEFTFVEKNQQKTMIILKTERGNLSFLKENLKKLSQKEVDKFNKSNKWKKELILKNDIDPESFPYVNILFFYVDVIKKKAILKPLKKEIINNEEYIIVKAIKNFTEEEFLVKPNDLQIIQ